MKELSVFDFTSYRSYISAYVSAQEEAWGLLTKLAKQADCHRPYLSKVLKGEAHLTSSQLHALALSWKFSSSQTEYFLRLLDIEKADKAAYRKYLVERNSKLKRDEEDLNHLVSRKSIEPESKDLVYHSSWVWSAVHILTSIPEFQTIDRISERLNLPKSQVTSMLENLRAWNSVKFENGKWKFAGNEHHLPTQSPLVTQHHSNWRREAVINSQLQQTENLHFTVVQSVSREDYQKLRSIILDSIKKLSNVANPSKEEMLYCFTCDLFEP